MSLAEQYELLELVHSDVATSWLALEKKTRRQLLLHQFKEDTGLRDRLISMAPNDLIMLLGAEKDGDTYIVVTHDVPALRQFRDWVESRSSLTVGPAAPRRPTTFDGEKTQLMPGKAVESTAAWPIAGQSGEFTQMFQAPVAGPRSPFAEAEPVSAPAKPPAILRNEPNFGPASGKAAPSETTAPRLMADEPSEFTQMFRSPAAAPRTPSLEPPVNPLAVLRNEPNSVSASSKAAPRETTAPRLMADEPGEFTQMFRSPGAAAPGNPRVSPPAVLPNEPKPAAASRFDSPSETTAPRLQADDEPADEPAGVLRNEANPVPANSPVVANEVAAAGTSAEPGEFTRMFRAPEGAANPPSVLRYEPNPVAAASSPVLPKNPPSVERPAEPGEFTRMFRAPAAGPANTPTNTPTHTLTNPAAVLRNEPNPVPPGAPDVLKQPGEFTRMFRSRDAAPVEPPSVLRNEANTAPASGPAVGNQPGDFTLMFKTPEHGKAAPVARPPAKPAGGPGDFTKMFSNPLPTTPLAEKLEPTYPVSKEAAPPRAASDFTHMFGQPQQGAGPGMPAPMNAGATGIFSGPKVPSSGMQPSAPTGPSEYTRMFATPTTAPAPADVAAPTANVEKTPEPQGKAQQGQKLWPLVIVLAVLAIATILLLVYLLRKR